MLSNGHAGFGGRAGETHRGKPRWGAPARSNNLGDAVDRVVRSHRKCLRHPAEPAGATEPVAPGPPLERISQTSQVREQNTQRRHAEIHTLLGDGVGITRIGQMLNLDRKTVRRYARAAGPEQLLTEVGRRGSDLDEHLPCLAKRWEQGCDNAATLHHEIRERGYRGSPRTVRRLLQDWRTTSPPPLITVHTPPKPRQVTGWIMRPDDKLADEDKTELRRVLDRCATLRQVDQLVSDFAGMTRHRQGRHLDTWIAQATSSGIPAIAGFAAGLLEDYDAVRNGLTLEHSSGAVEGHVNRIK
ncbi:transposase [Nocardia brevicatena]|uniref:transposase n=1 Tax=Nocardia brevicatena TaxID=37327 RepID=UPI0002D8BD4F|nr:transposase [Nocardia brevicatena]